MKVITVDNGSAFLSQVRAALGDMAGEVLGYPFVPGEFAALAAAADAVVLSGAQVPAGVDLPYEEDELKAIAACRKPVLGIGKGAALLLAAHGAKVKAYGGGYEVRRAPEGWSGSGNSWRRGSALVAELEPQDVPAAVRAFLEGIAASAA